LSEAKSAASSAATLVAVNMISDAVTRVTRVEERIGRLSDGTLHAIGEAGRGF
jgi:hypothetical protein